MAPLALGHLMFYPEAFDEESVKTIHNAIGMTRLDKNILILIYPLQGVFNKMIIMPFKRPYNKVTKNFALSIIQLHSH